MGGVDAWSILTMPYRLLVIIDDKMGNFPERCINFHAV